MNKKNNYTQFLCVLLAIFVVFIISSCIKDADEEQQKPPSETLSELSGDSIFVDIDSAFQASLHFLSGEWTTEYEGYDPQQSASSGKDVVSRIRRAVIFSDDGHYESHVQGIANVSDTITEFKEFEHEYGTYVFDVVRQSVRYVVEYDSLINFQDGNLTYHEGKVRGKVELKEYDEKMWFSKEQEGKRDWIRIDENLMSTANHDARLIYVMKNQQ